MTNPNDTYKRAVLDLQARLGRPPTTRDPEYVKLGEELREAWKNYGHAEETVLPPTKPRTSEEQRAMYERQRNHARGGWEQGMTADARDGAREATLQWSCGQVVRPGEMYHQHVDRCLRDQSSADDAREADIRAAEEHVLGTLAEYARGIGAEKPELSADDAYARAHRALGGPGAAENASEAVTVPEAIPGPDSASQPVMVGSRGPNGGIYAVCSACQRVWERPKQRGRPAYKCEECRE